MTTAPSGSSWTPQKRARERELLDELAGLDALDPRREDVRDELVTMHLPLVRHIARKYRDRGEDLEDLVQVGTMGLIKAVDRFEVDRGLEFSTYATPLILGEVRRHFRDRSWSVRMPRRLQERSAQVASATEALTNELGRSPTVAEIAERLECSSDDVLEALEARQAFTADSLDADPEEASRFATAVGSEDPYLQAVEDRAAVSALLDTLPERERQIVELRFFREMSQSQIAAEMGMSQMHVSRLLGRSLALLREQLT